VFLAFRHAPDDGLGRIADSLGGSFEYVDLFREGAAVPDVRSARGLIFLGGEMSANDDLPFIRAEIELIGEAVARGVSVLGICLGAQLIARALGARVSRSPVKEIGWRRIRWSPAAAALGLRGADSVFQWHGEAFDLPDGAGLLASSDACANQAFHFAERRVLGLQFHLEAKPERIAAWIEQDRRGVRREIEEPVDPYAHAERLKEVAERLFGAWRDLASGE
jgi:GMP synthase-like glutamine amidotransferase